jgi:hypothetical protein
MVTFIAIYRGKSVADARLIAVSADPALVGDVSARLLQHVSREHQDTVVNSLEEGRAAALRLINEETCNEK